MIIYHKHHIIPRHMGGSDDPSNIIKLTLEEHARAHEELYEKYGNEYDRIAWLSLSGMINKDEIIQMAQIENGRRAAKRLTKEDCSKGGKTNMRLHPEISSIGGKALWSKPGMRDYLCEKRKEQSLYGKNPMLGKKQKRVCCLCCKQEFPINLFARHIKKVGGII